MLLVGPHGISIVMHVDLLLNDDLSVVQRNLSLFKLQSEKLILNLMAISAVR